MKEFSYIIKDPQGVHARPAGILVRQAQSFSSKITVKFGEKTADAKKLFALMGMGIKTGNEMTLILEGEDEAAAAEALETFLEENL